MMIEILAIAFAIGAVLFIIGGTNDTPEDDNNPGDDLSETASKPPTPDDPSAQERSTNPHTKPKVDRVVLIRRFRRVRRRSKSQKRKRR